MRRLFVLIALCATGFVVWPLGAQPAPKVAAGGLPRRTPEQIDADLKKAGNELREVITSTEVVLDPAQRRQAAAKAIPIFKRMIAALSEVDQQEKDPDAKAQIADARMEFLTLLSVFGDADSAATLDQLAKGAGVQAVQAQSARQLVAYWNNPKDEAAQIKALDELRKIAKANPREESLVQMAMKMINMGAASDAVKQKAEEIIIAELTSQYAQQAAIHIKGLRKLRTSLGKPVELAGTQLDGTPFSTKDWKGKVILVDFWATWCEPCIAELPKVKKAYINHHAHGLEILGVSSDLEEERLKSFLGQNKDMPWPQLFKPGLNEDDPLHPLGKEWGVTRLPSMFLIDRKGILRNVEAYKDYEEQIPKLLAE